MFFSRGPNKIQNPYTLKDIYKHYTDSIDKNSPFDINFNLYKSIVEDYIKEIMNLVFEGNAYSIPATLGLVQVVKVKMNYNIEKSLPIDWEFTNKYGKRIYNLNEHSRGFRYKFQWFKGSIHLHLNNNYILYRLIMTRANKRRLAKIIKSGEKDYFQID